MKLAEKDPSKSASSKADKTKKATAGQETTKPKAVKKELIKKFPVMSVSLIKYIAANLIKGIEFIH